MKKPRKTGKAIPPPPARGKQAPAGADSHLLLHELRVHQAELESQNRELRETHQLLEVSRDRYADLYDFAPVGYLTHDERGLIQEINLTAAEMLGVERSRLIGLPLSRYVARGDIPAFHAHPQHVLKFSVPLSVEVGLVVKGGGILRVELQSARVEGPGLARGQCRTTLTNVTRRYEAEEALRESSERLELALAGADLGLWDRDLVNNKQTINERWAAMLGYTRAELEAGSISWDDLLHPDDRPRATAALEAHFSGRLPQYEAEFRLRCKSGEWRWILSRGKVVRRHADGRPLRFSGTHLDITARRSVQDALVRSESRLAQAQRIAHLGSFEFDPTGKSASHWSEEIYRILELPPGRTAPTLDEYFNRFVFPEDRARVRESVEKAAQDNTAHHAEYRIVRPDGSLRYVHSVAEKVPDNDGHKLVGTVQDVTDVKRLQAEMVRAVESEQVRIGHELHDGLCQQLAFIEFRLYALQEKLGNAEKAEFAKLATLIRQAMEQTRTQARGLSPVVLGAGGLADALRDMAAHTEKAFGVSCVFRCRQPITITDNVVAAHLYRIVQEAVHNAVRHGKPKRIDIRLRQTHDRFVVGVKDDGVGFTPPSSGHRGMGLRIMHYRAALVSGSLAVQRGTKGGTSVICVLARKRSAAGSSAPPPPPRESGRLVRR